MTIPCQSLAQASTFVTPFDVVNAFVVHFSAAVDLHSILELAARLHYYWTQLPLAIDFYFFQNVDFGSGSVRSRMQHGGDCPSSENFAQNSARMDTKVDTKPLSY